MNEHLEDNKKYKYDVFISSAKKDNHITDNIIKDLDKEGISYWIDRKQIKPVSFVMEEIQEGLQDSKYVLVCLSNNYLKSEWCKKEYETILNKEYAKKEPRKIIVLIFKREDKLIFIF